MDFTRSENKSVFRFLTLLAFDIFFPFFNYGRNFRNVTTISLAIMKPFKPTFSSGYRSNKRKQDLFLFSVKLF